MVCAFSQVAMFFQKSGLPDWAVLVLISMTPAIELRGAVPVGNWMGYSPAITFAICVIGNMLPIAPMLLALRSAFFKKLAKPLLSPRAQRAEAAAAARERARAAEKAEGAADARRLGAEFARLEGLGSVEVPLAVPA